jgi:hypothetical protein
MTSTESIQLKNLEAELDGLKQRALMLKAQERPQDVDLEKQIAELTSTIEVFKAKLGA